MMHYNKKIKTPNSRTMLGQQIIIQTDGLGNKKQRFIKKQKIGSGGFAKCYMLQNCQSLEKVAAKVIETRQLKQKSTKTKIIQQIQIHRQLDHPHIVKFYDSFEFEDQMYIIMELCQNNTLKEFIRNRVRITQFQAKVYMHQIISAVQYLHSINILHRDLKLGNLFLNFRMEVKIGDFGLSKQLKNSKDRRYTTCGTPNYIAPEILKETGHSFEADIWAIGIILYAMIFGKPPFESQSVDQTYRKIKSNNYQFPKQIPVSNEAKDLIRGILQPNIKIRLTLQQIKKHPFLNKEIQKIPTVMPPYTISIPPQTNFLKQFITQKNMKLLIYPKKVYDNLEKQDKNSKLGRVLSADKKMLLRLSTFQQESKDGSSLNRGRYLKILRTQSLSKCQMRHLKGFRSAASIGSLTPKSIGMDSDRNALMLSSPKLTKQNEDINQIICYYDISQKYGVAYLLSNGSYGIIFNDRTSLTAIPDPNSENGSISCYMFFNKKQQKYEFLPDSLSKKKQILKLCEQKLAQYRKNNVLIPYFSETHIKKYMKYQDGYIMKLSNGLLQFFWGADSVTLRNYKWARWRVNQMEGEGQLAQIQSSEPVQEKIQIVKQFLYKQCINSKTKGQENKS